MYESDKTVSAVHAVGRGLVAVGRGTRCRGQGDSLPLAGGLVAVGRGTRCRCSGTRDFQTKDWPASNLKRRRPPTAYCFVLFADAHRSRQCGRPISSVVLRRASHPHPPQIRIRHNKNTSIIIRHNENTSELGKKVRELGSLFPSCVLRCKAKTLKVRLGFPWAGSDFSREVIASKPRRLRVQTTQCHCRGFALFPFPATQKI